MKRKLSILSIAVMSLFPVAENAMAQSNADLKREIDLLKSQLQALEAKIQATTAAAAPAVDPDDFNRIKVKTEALEDGMAFSGFKGLKINGMVDPTFIYSQRQNQSGFVFLNNFDGRGNSGTNDAYAYDNSYFGQAMLDIQKETESGTKWRLTLAPHKSSSSGYNLGSIVHEASVSVPLTDPGTRLIAGQLPDWSGYEYSPANMQPLVTHNLLFDFTIPSFYSGAGMEITRGPVVTKFMLGNLNQASRSSGDKPLSLSYRSDYAVNEFLGLGLAGSHSRSPGNKFDLFEVDGTFNRGNLTLQGQLGAGQKKNAAANGDTAQWWGVSTLAGYKLTPQLQAVARLDYINNHKNGGGVFGSTSSGCLTAGGVVSEDATGADCAVTMGDYRNGFGPSYQDAVDYATGVSTSLRGVNRYALTTGLNYLLNANTTLKGEVRYDGATGNVFYDVKSATYKKGSVTIGASVVVFF